MRRAFVVRAFFASQALRLALAVGRIYRSSMVEITARQPMLNTAAVSNDAGPMVFPTGFDGDKAEVLIDPGPIRSQRGWQYEAFVLQSGAVRLRLEVPYRHGKNTVVPEDMSLTIRLEAKPGGKARPEGEKPFLSTRDPETILTIAKSLAKAENEDGDRPLPAALERLARLLRPR